MTTIVLPTLWWHDSQQTNTVVTCWSGWDLPCGDMIYHGIYTVVTLQPSSILWWHDYQHQTNTVVTWLLEGDVHCGDMTTIMVPTLWNLYCGSTTSNMRFTLKWPDCCQRIYTVMTWRPPTYPLSGDWNSIMLYLHSGDMTFIMAPTLQWTHYHSGTYTMVIWQPSEYLHCSDLTTNVVSTLWWYHYHHGTYTGVTWLPLWYLHRGDITTIMVPTL